jgi:hypothetical protein
MKLGSYCEMNSNVLSGRAFFSYISHQHILSFHDIPQHLIPSPVPAPTSTIAKVNKNHLVARQRHEQYLGRPRVENSVRYGRIEPDRLYPLAGRAFRW